MVCPPVFYGNDAMPRSLLIGFGNRDRADDGVAWHVINAVRRRLGQTTLPEDDTGLDSLGNAVDAVFLSQLTPELAEIMQNYDTIFFIDAHVYEEAGDLHCRPVRPEAAALTFTHHISPAMMLALLQALYRRQPAGYLVSIRGDDFDFHRNLSSHTQSLVEPAVDHIFRQIAPQRDDGIVSVDTLS